MFSCPTQCVFRSWPRVFGFTAESVPFAPVITVNVRHTSLIKNGSQNHDWIYAWSIDAYNVTIVYRPFRTHSLRSPYFCLYISTHIICCPSFTSSMSDCLSIDMYRDNRKAHCINCSISISRTGSILRGSRRTIIAIWIGYMKIIAIIIIS